MALWSQRAVPGTSSVSRYVDSYLKCRFLSSPLRKTESKTEGEAQQSVVERALQVILIYL